MRTFAFACLAAVVLARRSRKEEEAPRAEPAEEVVDVTPEATEEPKAP